MKQEMTCIAFCVGLFFINTWPNYLLPQRMWHGTLPSTTQVISPVSPGFDQNGLLMCFMRHSGLLNWAPLGPSNVRLWLNFDVCSNALLDHSMKNSISIDSGYVSLLKAAKTKRIHSYDGHGWSDPKFRVLHYFIWSYPSALIFSSCCSFVFQFSLQVFYHFWISFNK